MRIARGEVSDEFRLSRRSIQPGRVQALHAMAETQFCEKTAEPSTAWARTKRLQKGETEDGRMRRTGYGPSSGKPKA